MDNGEWDQLYTLDHTKYDPMEEEFMQRNKFQASMILQRNDKLRLTL